MSNFLWPRASPLLFKRRVVQELYEGLYKKVLFLDALVRRADVEARGAAVAHLAAGESVIKYKSSLNVLKDTIIRS